MRDPGRERYLDFQSYRVDKTSLFYLRIHQISKPLITKTWVWRRHLTPSRQLWTRIQGANVGKSRGTASSAMHEACLLISLAGLTWLFQNITDSPERVDFSLLKF